MGRGISSRLRRAAARKTFELCDGDSLASGIALSAGQARYRPGRRIVPRLHAIAHAIATGQRHLVMAIGPLEYPIPDAAGLLAALAHRIEAGAHAGPSIYGWIASTWRFVRHSAPGTRGGKIRIKWPMAAEIRKILDGERRGV